MHMPRRSLSEIDIEQVRSMYSTGMYTKIGLAKKFNCSETTIRLWLPKEDTDREKKFRSQKILPICYKCNEFILTHKRCEYCTILLHNKPCTCNENH